MGYKGKEESRKFSTSLIQTGVCYDMAEKHLRGNLQKCLLFLDQKLGSHHSGCVELGLECKYEEAAK